MQEHTIVSREDWIEARKAHLAKEKEFPSCAISSAPSAANCPG